MPIPSFSDIRQNPLGRAALLQGGALLVAVLLAAAVAWPFGGGISVLGILIAYLVLSVAATAWRLREPSVEEDETADALAAFAAEPLGAVILDAKGTLVAARRAVGRDAAMYRPLDRLVRATRKIERRLALNTTERPAVHRVLTQQMPLIATTAEQYVRLHGETLTDEQADRMIVAEGVLREAGDRLEAIARGDVKTNRADIGLIRMDANAEVLAERMATDMDMATARAAALRGAHALQRAAKSADGQIASQMRGTADRIERLAAEDGPLLRRFVQTDLAGMIAAADDVAAGTGDEAEERLRAHLRRLVQLEAEMTPLAAK